MIDLNEIIGTKYVVGGRTIQEGLDCYGLVKFVYKENLGIGLPDWVSENDSVLAISRVIKNSRDDSLESGDALQIEEPEENCIVLTSKKTEAHHIGVFMHRGVLHASKEYGTAWHDWAAFKRLFMGSKIRFYRWQA